MDASVMEERLLRIDDEIHRLLSELRHTHPGLKDSSIVESVKGSWELEAESVDFVNNLRKGSNKRLKRLGLT